jgi:hypothetical protein
MVTIEIAGLYVVVVAAILSGLLLLWFMLLELLRFDSKVTKPRSARVSVPASPSPAKPVPTRLPSAPRAPRAGSSWRPVHSAPR